MIRWQMVLLLNGLFSFAVGATVGWVLRRHAAVAVVAATAIVLLIHAAVGYFRSGFPPITLRGFINGLEWAAVPLLLFGWLPTIGGVLLVVVARRGN